MSPVATTTSTTTSVPPTPSVSTPLAEVTPMAPLAPAAPEAQWPETKPKSNLPKVLGGIAAIILVVGVATAAYFVSNRLSSKQAVAPNAPESQSQAFNQKDIVRLGSDRAQKEYADAEDKTTTSIGKWALNNPIEAVKAGINPVTGNITTSGTTPAPILTSITPATAGSAGPTVADIAAMNTKLIADAHYAEAQKAAAVAFGALERAKATYETTLKGGTPSQIDAAAMAVSDAKAAYSTKTKAVYGAQTTASNATKALEDLTGGRFPTANSLSVSGDLPTIPTTYPIVNGSYPPVGCETNYVAACYAWDLGTPGGTVYIDPSKFLEAYLANGRTSDSTEPNWMPAGYYLCSLGACKIGNTTTTLAKGGGGGGGGTAKGGSNITSTCTEQCPGSDGVLRSCTPPESDGSSADSLCAWAGRVEGCGGRQYCCPAAGGAWTTDMTACPTANNVVAGACTEVALFAKTTSGYSTTKMTEAQKAAIHIGDKIRIAITGSKADLQARFRVYVNDVVEATGDTASPEWRVGQSFSGSDHLVTFYSDYEIKKSGSYKFEGQVTTKP